MPEIYHVDTQFLRNALSVFEDLKTFEQAARSRDAAQRAKNVATLVDALDLCNLLVLGDRIVFDSDVGGGRQQHVLDQIDRVATWLRDAEAADMFRAAFGGVAPVSKKASRKIELEAARGSTAFFPRLARCATNVLDLFYLPHRQASLARTCFNTWRPADNRRRLRSRRSRRRRRSPDAGSTQRCCPTRLPFEPSATRGNQLS
jgi:hypothetical protein